MTLEGEVTLFDPFTHTEQDREKILNFNFYQEKQTKRIAIEETFCTLVTVSGKYLEKNTFKTVFKKIYEIRRIIIDLVKAFILMEI